MSYTKSSEIIIEQPPSYNINNYQVLDNDLNKHIELISISENELIQFYELIGSQYIQFPSITNIKNNYTQFLNDSCSIIRNFANHIHNFNQIKEQYDNERIILNTTNLKNYSYEYYI